MTDSPTAIDLFAGAGGLTEGLAQSGFKVTASVELHPQAGLTQAFNHPTTKVVVGDIRAWDPRSVAGSSNSSVTLVAGGPPCQGFSSAGKKSATDPRNGLFNEFARVVEVLQPEAFLLENVPGFRSMYGGTVYSSAVRQFRHLGYHISDHVLNTSAYGVPQKRRRFVMIGFRDKRAHEALDLKIPTEFDNETSRAALHDLAFLRPGFEATRYSRRQAYEFAKQRQNVSGLVFNHLATKHRERAVGIMQQIPRGGTIRQVDKSLRTAKQTMSRIDPKLPSNTILSLPDDLIHYEHDRILTVREAARLQTFDDSFVFFGKRTSGYLERRVDLPQYTQVGNAVPPLFAKALGVRILDALGYESGVDRRDIDERVRRHDYINGTSGYGGYGLHPDLAGSIELVTVSGERLAVPALDAPSVRNNPRLVDWTRLPRPREAQWAPGVKSRPSPNWKDELAG